MSKSLGTLTLDLIARTGGFVQGMSKAERSAAKWRKQVDAHLRKVGGEFARVAKLAAGAGVAAAGAFTIMAKEGLQHVDSQAKMARQVGASIDGLRGLQIAANDAGIDTNTLNGAVDRLNARLGEARQGSGQAYEALKRLGLSADELARMDADQRIAVISDRVQDLGLDSADTADLLRNLGIRNREMVNLLMAGGEGIRTARQEVDAYGLSLSEVDAKAVEDANDTIGRIPRALEPIKNQIAINVAEPLENVAELFNEASKASNGFASEVTEGLAIASETVGELFKNLDGVRILLMKIQRFQVGVEAFAEQSRMNAASQGMGRMSNYGLDNQAPESGPATEEYNRLTAAIEALESGENLFQRAAEFAGDQAERIRSGPERRERLQAGIDAGLGLDSGVNSAAIAGAVAFTESLKDVTEEVEEQKEITEENTEVTKDHTEKTRNAAEAVKDFGDTASSSARAIQAAVNGMGDDPRYGFDPDEGTASSRARARFEASANRIGDPNVINLGGNDSAKPTWSRDFLDPAASAAEGVSARAPWFGGDEGLQKVSRTVESVSGRSSSTSGGSGGPHLGTLTLASEKGGNIDVQAASDELTKWLADTLSGTAAGSR